MVFPDRQKKRSLSGFFQGLSWAGHPKFKFSFIIILAKPPLTHIVIFWLIMCKLLVWLLRVVYVGNQ